MDQLDMISITDFIRNPQYFIQDLQEDDCIFGISYEEYLNHYNNNNNVLIVSDEG
tara:strand:+ start:37 stop:201 length:165 start_codon:yes stop_codon:yes gene_type:complete